MLTSACLLLLALGTAGPSWTGDIHQVDAVIVDHTRKVWQDGGNLVTQPYRRLIVVDGQRMSSRRLQTEPQVLRSAEQTIIVYQYWGEAQAIRTRHYHEIETSDQAWLESWRWQEDWE